MERRLLKENKKFSGPGLNIVKADLPPLLKNSAIHRKYGLTTVISKDFAGTLYATAKRAGGKAVAVKVLREGYSLISNTLGNIEHPRICQVLHTIIERDKIQAVVFEKPEGHPLGEMIRDAGALTPGQAVSAGLQLLSALHAVHWNDAYVGNLHADSIFLSRDTRGNLELQLTNLGVGCIHDKLQETDYLAPEQIMGGKGGNRSSDIWAVGVILYEMLFGVRPFTGENRYATAGEILLQEPDFSQKPEGVPDDLIAFIKRALKKDESDRFPDIAEMVSELLPFQSEFNEPMSPAAKSAIVDSHPLKPEDTLPPKGAPTAAKTAASPPKARVIPTVRISHTPSKPPEGIGEKRGAFPGRSGKQTKLGMPAISLPAKRIPLKSSDDTASIATKKSSPAPYTARLSEPPGKAVREFPRPKESADMADTSPITQRAFAVLSRTITGARALASAGAKLTGAFPKLVAGTPKPSELKAGFVSLTPNLKALVLGSAALFVTVLTVLIAVSGGDAGDVTVEGSASDLAAKTAAELTTYRAEMAAAALEHAPDPTPTPTPQPTAVANKEVTIALEGELPKRARIKINDKPVKPPIVVEASDTPLTLTISARGFAPFEQQITPSEDLTVDVELERPVRVKRGGKRGGGRTIKKHGGKKSGKSGENLASNPFGG